MVRRDATAAHRTSRFRGAGRRAWTIGALILGIVLHGAAARAAAPDSSESYWGPIPTSPDTVCVPLLDKPRPLWEKAVLAPYRVVTFPIALTSRGVGDGIAYLDEHSVIQDVARLLGPRT